MDLPTFERLRTAEGEEALARAADLAPTEATLLACLTRLRRDFPPDLARAALETVLLRRRAAGKFARAGAMFFTAEALEQATGETVARYRAERFAPFPTVADFCCGIGGDTIALAESHRVAAVDADPLRLAMAEHNLDVYGLREQATFLLGDLLSMPLPDTEAAFFDPDRRPDGKRRVSPRHYQPSPEKILGRLPAGFPLGMKLAPAVSWNDLEGLDAEIEFISLDGELKECIAWFGPLRTCRRRATLLPSRATLNAEVPAAAAEIAEPAGYLYDPDPAVVRAGLVTNLAERLGARQIDEEIAYLTAEDLRPTPFATAYRIEEVHPFNAKVLAERLRALKVGRVTVTKRGSAVAPEALLRRLKLGGPEHRDVILTRGRGKPIMLIGSRVSVL